ncbi:hypothetical protein [Enterovibrio nigricans]|nr:hypothetical protein [Enterovibrio nigricans]PKF48790.1 hypothetical protein AT251_23570 [Enterovibrio nigricans]
MTELNNKLFCEKCGTMTTHTRVELEPRKAQPDSSIFQRATIILSNSMDLMLGSAYHQCDRCGATYGHSESFGGF